MEDNEETEIRFYLIGVAGVGKKTLQKRLQNLQCTKELSIKYAPKIYKPTQQTQSKLSKDQATQDEKKSGSINYTIQHYDLSPIKLGFRVFTIPEAESVDIDYEPEEDDSDNEIATEYRIIFKKAKQALKYYIELPSYASSVKSIKHIFLFIHDLSIPESLDQLRIYHHKLATYLKINDHEDYYQILIGNKCEKKIILNKTQLASYEDFISVQSFQKYEMSCKLWFDFDQWFIQMFFGIFPDYNSNAKLKEKFEQIINSKPSFSKAQRKWFNIEDAPGPSDYYTNLFRYDTHKEMIESLDNKQGRFTKKIFANKIGLVFNKEVKTSKKKEIKRKDESSPIIFNSANPNFNLILNPVGYSLGLVPGKYNLKKERNEMARMRSNELKRSFEDNITHINDYPEKKKLNSEKYFTSANDRKKDYLQSIVSNRKERIDRYADLHERNNDCIISIQRKKSNAILQSALYPLNDEERRKHYVDSLYGNNANHLLRSEDILQLKKKERIYYPGPQSYDIRTKLTGKDKGFTITGKPKDPNGLKNKDDPQFVYLKTDFDLLGEKMLLDKAEGKVMPSYAERFKPIEKEPLCDDTAIQQKMKRYEENKNDSDTKMIYQMFFDDRKVKKLDHDYILTELREREEEKRQRYLKRKGEDYDDCFYPCINYKQVEENTPMYSIKGKGNYSIVNTAGNIDKKILNSKNKSNEINIKDLPDPKLSYVKPSLNGYTFEKADRWLETSSRSPLMPEHSYLFENGKYAPDDHIDYSSKSSFHLNDQRTKLQANDYPGPAHYSPSSFLDKYTRIKLPVVKPKDPIQTEANNPPQLTNEILNYDY